MTQIFCPEEFRVGVGYGPSDCTGLIHAYDTRSHEDICLKCGTLQETTTVPNDYLKRTEEEAKLWRALITSERIRFLGSAHDRTEDWHMGLELWNRHPDFKSTSPREGHDYAVAELTAFARARFPLLEK